MQLDQQKFMNMVLDKTSEKMNQLQVQVIVLETQLAMAVDNFTALQAQLTDLQKKLEETTQPKKKSDY